MPSTAPLFCLVVAGGVAHQVHDAALPRGAGEDLLDGALEPLMGVAGDADDAVDPACAQRKQERLPAVIGLRVDGGHERGRLHASCVPALDVGGVEPDVGVADVRQSRSCRSATDSSSDEHILDTWLALMRSMPMDCATRFTFLVDTPLATISETADLTARSTREYRLIRSSEKYVPERSFGILRLIVPTLVASLHSR